MLNFFIFSPTALENGRGGEFYELEMAAELQKFYKITIVHTNRFLGRKLLSMGEIIKKKKNVHIKRRIKYAKFHIGHIYFDFPYPWDLFNLYRDIKKVDIFYSPLSNFKTNLILIFLSLVTKRPRFIIGYHRPLYSNKIISLYNAKLRLSILILSLFKKKFYHQTISLYAKKFLENYYNPNKVYHIVEGLNLDNFFEYGDDLKIDDKLNFIYVGYLDDIHKGVGVLIEGISRFLEENKNLDVSFEFCGTGPLELQVDMLEKRFPQHIKFNGYVQSHRIIEIYNKNDILLFTSRREPFGRVIIEALASNLIILCTKTIGSIEILKGKEFAFFLEKLNPQNIKKEISELHKLWKKNPHKFKELQTKARQYAFENYSISKEINQYRELISKINTKKSMS